MKNIEKYKDTASALEAWKQYRATDNPNIGFEDWCELDWIEPLSLLEAAKSVKEWMSGCIILGCEGEAAYKRLKYAIAEEEARPKRNFERFATAEEAYEAFRKMCKSKYCSFCRLENEHKYSFGDSSLCVARWFYLSDSNLLRDDGAGHAEKMTGEEERK